MSDHHGARRVTRRARAVACALVVVVAACSTSSSVATTTTTTIAPSVEPVPEIVAGAGVPASTASEPSGNFRLICNFSHLSYDDPILSPGDHGASHLHVFFGNTLADANSTYDSLRSTGESTCAGGIKNRSSYWMPAVLNADDKVVIPEYAAVYYKANGTPESIATVRVFPKGLKMVAGFNMNAVGDATHFDWNCEITERKQQIIPDCPEGELVGVVIRFPSCWDGRNLDSADHRSHMAYTEGHDFTGICPASHPVRVPEYTVGFWFLNDGQSSAWHLVSDEMPDMQHANGSTFHADWFGAWDPDVEATWVTSCIQEMRDCKAGELGDGTQLNPALAYPNLAHAGPAIVDLPPVP